MSRVKSCDQHISDIAGTVYTQHGKKLGPLLRRGVQFEMVSPPKFCRFDSRKWHVESFAVRRSSSSDAIMISVDRRMCTTQCTCVRLPSMRAPRRHTLETAQLDRREFRKKCLSSQGDDRLKLRVSLNESRTCSSHLWWGSSMQCERYADNFFGHFNLECTE